MFSLISPGCQISVQLILIFETTKLAIRGGTKAIYESFIYTESRQPCFSKEANDCIKAHDK